MTYSDLYRKIRTVLNFETTKINQPYFEREQWLHGLSQIYSDFYCKIGTVLNFETAKINQPHFEREEHLHGFSQIFLRLKRISLIFLRFDDKILK